MNLSELVSQGRSQLDDIKLPYLWTDDDFVMYAQYAVNRMCESCKFLVDSDTAEICTITPITEGTALYPLDPRIIEVTDVHCSWRRWPLEKYDMERVRSQYNWLKREDLPWAYLLDYQIDKIRLYPVPKWAAAYETVTHSLSLFVVRYPLVPFTSSDLASQFIEIPERYHIDLINGIKGQAYLKSDSETYNEKLADFHNKMFESRINQISKEIHNRTKSPQTAGPLKAFT